MRKGSSLGGLFSCYSSKKRKTKEDLLWGYGLGSGCYAEPRVEESIGSKQQDRNKLVVKTEERSNEREHTF